MLKKILEQLFGNGSACASQIKMRKMALGFKEANIVMVRGLNMLKAGPGGYESSNEEYQRASAPLHPIR